MNKLRGRLSFANVMSVIAVCIALGGTSYAAFKLPKNSVGSKQLKKNSVTKAKIKKNAVTAAKIKKNAVTAAKIQNGAVDGAKVKDGSLTGGDVDAATMPFSRVVAKLRGNSTVEVPTTIDFAPYPLDNATYTQAANEDDRYAAAVDVTFQPSCEGPTRRASAFLLIDTNPAALSEFDLLGTGAVEAGGPGTVSKRIEIGGSGSRFEPGTAKQHTLSLFVSADCTTGSGVITTFGGVDVIGTTS
jgi:hypothetical protein